MDNSPLAILGETTEWPLDSQLTTGGNPIWVLTVMFAGQPWRWATEEIDIDTDAGTTLHIPGGLKADPEESADLLQLDSPELSISATGLIPLEDLSALIELGHEFDNMPAEVALWYPGRSWEQRLVILRGKTWLPAYGTHYQPISLTVESPMYQENGRLLDPSGVVSSVTWSTTKPGDRVDGRVYPLVIGRPDWVPAIIYDTVNDRAVVAQGMVGATQVTVSRIDDSTTTYEYDAATSFVRDSLGRWVTRIGYNAALGLGLGYADTMEMIGRWNDTGTLGGGILSEQESGYVTGLGDVVRFAMRRSTIPIDEGRWRALDDRLNRFLIDYWTNDPELTPWEFVRDDLLPLVPVSILHGPRGLYPVWWPYDETGGAHDRVASVDVQATGLQRSGDVEYERGDQPVNELTLEYYSWQGDLWRYRLTFTGRDIAQSETTDTFLVKTAPLAAAYARHRELRADKLMQSRAIYQRSIAEMVLGWRQYARCRSPRVVAYDDKAGRWAWLRPGMVVQLVDDELGIDRLAWVRRRAWSVGAVRLQFMLWDGA